MRNLITLASISAVLIFCASVSLRAQGWAKTYDYEIYDSTHTLLKTSTGYLLIGETIVNVDMDGEVIWSTPLPGELGDGGNRKAALLPDGSFVVFGNSANAVTTLWKFSINGTLQWEQDYGFTPNPNVSASSVAVTNDGGFILLSRADDSWLTKTDQNGQIEWQIAYFGFKGFSVTALIDGGYAMSGYSYQAGNKGKVKTTDNLGNEQWEYATNINWATNRASIVQTSDGNLVSTMGNKLVKLDQAGTELWSINYNAIWPDILFARDLIETQDGIIAAILGSWSLSATNSLGLFSLSGQLLQSADLAPNLQNKQLVSIQKAHGTGWVAAGYYITNVNVWDSDMLFVKTDDDLQIFTDTIQGNIFLDADIDCEKDAGELGLTNDWSVKAAGDFNFWATPDANGDYELIVSPGEYEVSVHPPYPSALWEACESPVTVQVDPDIPVDVDFAMTGDSCPYMQVNMGVYNFRPCFNTSIVVTYSNNGLVTAEDATVSVTLDPALTYVESTIPLASQNGQELWFDLGDMEVNGHGLFFIEVAVACDQDLVGQTLCNIAHIFPDTTCEDAFNGPNIQVEAICNGDSINFTLFNAGGDMPTPQPYIVIEDNLIMMNGTYQLAEAESVIVSVQASAGATQHLIAEQDADLPPFLGNHYATASIEGCVGNLNVGAFGQFPSDDGEPWQDIDCTVVTNSYDPNDKSASPSGWRDEHFIDDRTELDYMIRFQNTGTDTAFHVNILDTLSSWLDPATIRLGASSHPCELKLSGQGILKFTFNDIMLPDSNVNEPLSHGFVKFRIAQQPGNPPGTVIENTAAIYFDNNAPVYTNTTFHTVIADWINFVDGSVETKIPSLKLAIHPNPMRDWAIVEVENLPPGENTLSLFDATGRMVLQVPFHGGNVQLNRNELPAGLYFFQVENGGRKLATAKIAIR